MEITPDKGTVDPPKRSFDIDDEAAAGAVIKLMGDKMRVTLGTPKSPYWPSPDTGYAQPKIFLEVTSLAKDTKKVRVDLCCWRAHPRFAAAKGGNVLRAHLR